MKKVLIVEDQKFLMQALTDTLKDVGFQVIQAFDGAQGLDLSIKEHPDLIFLDIVMPVMDGITMLKKLRQDPWGKTAVVIVLSNLTSAETIEAAKGEQVSDYLVKTNWQLADVAQLAKKTLHVE